jgi:DNA-binding NtrC family response regulator
MAGLGRVKVVLAREGSAPALYVADWGPGIPPDMRERLFEPYATSKRRGTGLGLAVCRRIAQEHEAQLTLVSPSVLGDSPAPATVFRVLFPRTDAAPEARKRLLVVDDEAIIRRVFRDLMGKECEVLEADTAEEALGYLRQAPVDLIVTDKNLPGLSGLDLAQEARRLHAQSRVILMTGYPSVLTAQQAIELGVLDYLLKPFDEIREVRDKIRAALAAPLPRRSPPPSGKRVDVYEDDPASARQLTEALALLGLETRVFSEQVEAPAEPPAAVVVSWDFGAAHGRKAVELGRARSQGAPFVVLSEHLTMEAALESLRGGAAACLPKLLTDVRALSRELARALKLG